MGLESSKARFENTIIKRIERCLECAAPPELGILNGKGSEGNGQANTAVGRG